jgi:hypothetical protein
MDDKLDPDRQVVLRYEPQSRRRLDENEYILFGASGAAEETELVLAASTVGNSSGEGDEIDDATVRAVDAAGHLPEDDTHFGNLQYLDDEED